MQYVRLNNIILSNPNKMRAFVLIGLWFISWGLKSQSLSLEECLRLSRANYPLMADFENIDKQLDLKLKTLNANYYPKLDASVQYTWQNDVPGLGEPMPGVNIPKAPKQQYKAFIDVQQSIYDGGMTKAAKQLEESCNITEKMGVEVQLFSIRSKVIDSYFLLLTLDEQLKQLEFRREIMTQRLKEMQSAVVNGVLLQSEVDLFKVELLKQDQDLYVLQEGRQATLEVLEVLTGTDLSSGIRTELPLVLDSDPRPEYSLFTAQKEQLSHYQQLKGRQRIPVLAGFGQVGYGNPGYNMLKDEMATFYMFGIRVKWNIWDWKSSANEKAVLQLQSESVNNQEATFTRNLTLAEKEIEARIRKLESILKSDDAIIELREKITRARYSQLNNGTVTAADYISEFNAESMARLAKQIHLIEKSKARVELNELGKQ